ATRSGRIASNGSASRATTCRGSTASLDAAARARVEAELRGRRRERLRGRDRLRRTDAAPEPAPRGPGDELARDRAPGCHVPARDARTQGLPALARPPR